MPPKVENSKAKNAKGFRQEDFNVLTDREHILKKPGMYIDSITRSKRRVYALMFQSDTEDDLKCEEIETDMPIGLERLFDEIIANSCDAIIKSVINGFKVGPITVTMDSDTISVKNISMPIPVVKHEKFDEWIPELVFTRTKAGSNFNDDNEGAGANGLGATVTAVYSTSFKVIIYDAVNHKSFEHEWVDNLDLDVSGEPIVDDYDGKENSVTVIYTADLKRFGYKNGRYPNEAEDIIRRICADSSLSCKTPVIFNDLCLDYPSVMDYARLYNNEIENPVLVYKWPKSTKIKTDEEGVQYSQSKGVLPEIELLMFSCPRGGVQIGLCNGILNCEGGDHVNSTLNSVAYLILENSSAMNLTGKDALSSVRNRIKNHVFVVVSVHGKNPEWNAQSKTIFRGFKPNNKLLKTEIILTPTDVNKILNWPAFTVVNESLRSEIISKTTKKVKGSTKLTRHSFKEDSAGWIDTPKADQTILAGCEGDSAKGYLRCIISADPQGFNKFGIFTFGGKIPNAIKFNDPYLIRNNAVFQELVAQQGLDCLDYTIEKNLKSLRHRYFMLVPDADVDGLHISVLVLGFFEYYFPTFIQAGLMMFWRTKIKNATRKGYKEVVFYTEYEYELWAEKQGDAVSKWTIGYYKGLGSSNKEAAFRDFKNSYILDFVKDMLASQTINIALRNMKGDSDVRKQWILQYDPKSLREEIKDREYKITNFINDEVRMYSKHTLVRHLVGRDGLRETSRKIMNTLIKHWNWFASAKPEKKMRVITLTAKIMEDNDYHHGDLSSCVMGLGCDIPGSNNITLVVPDGQFGTIFEGGKDRAAARYPFTYPNPILKYIFLKEDEDILEYNYEEGKKLEAKRYLPIIPLTLVNGVKSIATGWSSYIYSVSPIDITNWLINRLKGLPFEESEELYPWYRGHKGVTTLVETKIDVSQQKIEKQSKTILGEDGVEYDVEFDYDSFSENEETVPPEEISKYHMRSEGTYEVGRNGDIIITELPVGKWIDPYSKGSKQAIKNEKKRNIKIKNGQSKEGEEAKEGKKVWCLRSAIESGLIKDYKPESTVDNVRIVVKGATFPPEETIDKLKLYKIMGLGNMILLDDEDKPFKCESAKHVAEDFLQWRLPFYKLRKDKKLLSIQNDIDHLQKRISYINAVIEERLVIFRPNTKRLTRKQVINNIEELGLDITLYGKIKDDEFNEENSSLLSQKINALIEQSEELISLNVEDVMISDLKNFLKHYVEEYGQDQ